METHFEMELDGLKQKLLMMASHAETAVNQAVQALIQRDSDLAQQVREDDRIIDQFEVEIDELAIHLLSKAPLASDLRLVTVAMKISQNLERVGDEATKIAKRARDLSREPPLKLNLELPKMATLALGMLKAALDTFVNHNSTAARDLIPRDKEVDALNRKINGELIRHMMKNRDNIPRCLNLIIASRSLERIADHAKNVAEEVVYLCEAQDIRHSGAKGQGVPAPAPGA
jgi:phosphate transport system protein